MPRPWIGLLVRIGVLLAVGASFRSAVEARAQSRAADTPALIQHTSRSSPLDLELGGEIEGQPHGTTRYVTHEDLLALPQMMYTVTDDSNFKGATQVSGVSLEELTRHLGAAPHSDMVVAICDDQYRAHYPRAYVAAHHPLLVLNINGKPPSGWPKDSEGQGMDMGPFLISHPRFAPGSKIFSHQEEAQIPWGVVRLEFRNEKSVFAAIAPRGARSTDVWLNAGYRIAQQNCFRCHNMGQEGGTKAGRPWLVLSALATSSPEYFAAYVRNPQARNAHAQMPGNPGYDDKTLHAHTAYFQSFAAFSSEQKKKKP